jgi:3-methyladenine DNA glycosylase AlkD
MEETEVLALLERNRDERGIANWNQRFSHMPELKSFGIGLTRLRKLAKQVGRDHDLALQLWGSNYYDAKVIALLIDNPKLITRDQAERQVEDLQGGMLAHVFSSCDATLAKTPFVRELADRWALSEDPVRQRCGYGLLYELSKSKKKSTPDDAYFHGWIAHIEQSQASADTTTRMAMAGALMGIGKRNRALNTAAIPVAQAMGPIDFDETGNCDPFDVTKHLTSERLKKKFGLA